MGHRGVSGLPGVMLWRGVDKSNWGRLWVKDFAELLDGSQFVSFSSPFRTEKVNMMAGGGN